jgi:cytochrome c oxidase assembly protein subunit 15
VIGWWMVSSGLAQRTDVSHFRLAAHLLLALLILALIVWTILDLRALARDAGARPARLTRLGAVTGAILFVQLVFGAFTAGLNAGLVTNEWPLMNGKLFPSEVLAVRPFLDALVNDPAMIHWFHRWWAWVAVAALIMLARRAKAAGDRTASIAIHTAFGIQILLGIATVMTGVNIVLGVLHQLVGALLVIATVWGTHSVGRRARGFRG